MTTYYSLKEISELFNIPKSTLRYWESEGIINSSRNTSNDYREYTIEDIVKIGDIIFYRNFNYPIKSLKNIYNIPIQEKENFIINSIQELDAKIKLLKETKKDLKHNLNSVNEYKQMLDNLFLEDKPFFDSIVHIQLGNTTNINKYLKDQTILAVTFDLNTDIIKLYGSIDPSMGHTVLWEKDSQIKKYQPCLIKIPADQRPVIVNDIPNNKYGQIIGTYLVTDKSDDYFKGWIEILE